VRLSVFFCYFLELYSCIVSYGVSLGLLNNIHMASGSSTDDSSKHAHKMSKLDDFAFPYCRDATVTYEKLAKIGQGTFG